MLVKCMISLLGTQQSFSWNMNDLLIIDVGLLINNGENGVVVYSRKCDHGPHGQKDRTNDPAILSAFLRWSKLSEFLSWNFKKAIINGLNLSRTRKNFMYPNPSILFIQKAISHLIFSILRLKLFFQSLSMIHFLRNYQYLDNQYPIPSHFVQVVYFIR